MTSLLDFCNTDLQRQIIELHLKGMSSRKISKELGHGERYSASIRRTIQRIKSYAEDRGYSPENHRNTVYPKNQVVTGYSDLIRYPEDDPLGRVIGWIKTNRKLAEQVNDARTIMEAMALDIPAVKPAVYKGNPIGSHHFSLIPLGDPHIGLKTWEKEVGVEWDTAIAMRVYENVFRRLLERAPDTQHGILFNSGDFFHADNIAGETARSGHKLDLDGRPGYWLDLGVQIMRMLIDMCLQKYETVEFVNTPGNHDDILGLAMGVFANQLYLNEPRFTCHMGMDPFQYVERNKVALGFCHGHTCKLAWLPGKMAADQSEMWGRTLVRHWVTGHVHHNSWVQFKEHPGCSVETVGIVPPKDAYAHGAGYGASRGMQVQVWDDRGSYLPDRYGEPVLPTD